MTGNSKQVRFGKTVRGIPRFNQTPAVACESSATGDFFSS